jgi:hypothetical protein
LAHDGDAYRDSHDRILARQCEACLQFATGGNMTVYELDW